MASSAVDRLIRLLQPFATASSLVLVVALLASCDKADDAPNQEPGAAERSATDKTGDQASNSEEPSAKSKKLKIVYKDGPKPSGEAVLAQTDDITVRLSDFERAMRQSTLVAPDGQLEAPKEQLANPHLQVNVVRNLLTTKIVLQEAKRRGLEASKEEKVAALESKRRLSAYAPVLEKGDENSEALQKRGLTLEDLDAIAAELVLREKLRDALIAEISEDELWQAYRQQHDRMRLLLVSARNTPTMEEITALIDEQPERIKEHFEANKKRYRPPSMVRLTMLSPTPGEKVDKAVLEKAAARLDKGDKPEAIASELNLTLDANALLVRGENKEAFDSEPGSTGFQTAGARGAYAWKVQGKRASKEATLTKALEREIAAELLRQGSIVPSKGSRIKEAIASLEKLSVPEGDKAAKEAIDAVAKELEKEGLEVDHTPMFPRNGRGFIPGVGLAEEVVEAATSLTLDDPVSDEPILSRGKVWAVRVLDRQKKGREDFEKEKESFRAAYAKRVQNTLLDAFVSSYEQEHNVRMNLEALQIKYGMLQKN